MKSLLIKTFVVFLTSGISFGQNFVTNGGFENYTNCPTADGQLNLAPSWNSARGTCDLYNSCNNGNFSVPNNQIGYQNARTGNGYAGFFASQGWFEVREYLQIQLNEPLEPGVEYCVQFYLCLGDKLNSFDEQDFDLAVNNIGAYFSTTQYNPDPNNFNHIAVTPQIVNDPGTQQLTDTANWMLVEGQFIAAGGEQYMLIGSFNDEAGQNTTGLGPWNGDNKWSYYLIDDVRVTDCSCPQIFTGSAITPVDCYNGANASIISQAFGGTAPYTYSLSLNGNNIQNFPATTTSVAFENLIAGSYTLQITDSNLCTTDTVIVISNPTPIILNALVTNSTCEQANGGIDVTATGGTGSYTYLWSNGNESSNLESVVAGNYTIQVTDSNGCIADSTYTITTTPKPDISFEITPGLPASANTQVTFTDQSVANSGVIESFHWIFSNGIESFSPQVSLQFEVAGNYSLNYIISNSAGCFDTLQYAFMIEGDLVVPNILTINEDGVNDVFTLDGIQNFKQVSVTILNRWGNIIYQNLNYANEWKPKGLTEGVYFYKIELTPYSGESQTLNGFIELIE